MTDATLQQGTRRSYAYEWYVVVICMLAYIFSFVDRQILALMIEPIKQDLQLSDTQFSLLHGLAFSLFYAFMGIPIALLADRYSRPKIIAIGVAFWSLATAACGLSRNFAQMFLARIGVGVGEAALSPATYSMLSDMFPRDKLGRAVGIYSIGSFIGGGMAFLIGGYVINLLKSVDTVLVPGIGAMRPWQVTFFIVGLPGLLVALLILLTVRDPHRLGLRRNAAGQAQSPRCATPHASWAAIAARFSVITWVSRSTPWCCSRCWVGRPRSTCANSACRRSRRAICWASWCWWPIPRAYSAAAG